MGEGSVCFAVERATADSRLEEHEQSGKAPSGILARIERSAVGTSTTVVVQHGPLPPEVTALDTLLLRSDHQLVREWRGERGIDDIHVQNRGHIVVVK